MHKLKKIINFLETKYPKEAAEAWDPVGFSSQTKLPIDKILISLDLTKNVMNYAIKHDYRLILTHHPFLFSSLWSDDIFYNEYKFDIYNKFYEKQISHYALHTNFDSHKFGTSFQIAKFLGIEKNVFENDLKFGEIINWEKDTDSLFKLIKEKFAFESMSTNIKTNQKVKKIVFFAGSGDFHEIIMATKNYNLDVIITSDIAWNEWITYNHLNLKIIQVPHSIERVFSNEIKLNLLQEFENIKVDVFTEKQIIINK